VKAIDHPGACRPLGRAGVTARTTSPEAIMGDTLAGRLRALGTRGVLVQMAQRGQGRPARARALQQRGLWLAYEDQTDDLRKHARGQGGVTTFAGLPPCHRSRRAPTAPRDSRCSSAASACSPFAATTACPSRASVWSTGGTLRGVSRKGIRLRHAGVVHRSSLRARPVGGGSPLSARRSAGGCPRCRNRT
jgi:hypothetical protein